VGQVGNLRPIVNRPACGGRSEKPIINQQQDPTVPTDPDRMRAKVPLDRGDTSISPNIIKAGYKVNVFPSESEATLGIRALPDENHHHVLRSHVQGHQRPGG
jgi:acetylornithine deacetylase/succinyl-diaminopimelate desuccinylase-like protein